MTPSYGSLRLTHETRVLNCAVILASVAPALGELLFDKEFDEFGLVSNADLVEYR